MDIKIRDRDTEGETETEIEVEMHIDRDTHIHNKGPLARNFQAEAAEATREANKCPIFILRSSSHILVSSVSKHDSCIAQRWQQF